MARMKARLAIPMAAALLAAFAVGACSSSSKASGASANSPVTLTFWGTYGNGGNKAQQDVLNQLIPHSRRPSHDQGELCRRPVRLAAAEADHERRRRPAARPRALRPRLGSAVRQPRRVRAARRQMPTSRRLREATYPGTLSTNLYKGKYYGLPLDTNTRVLITNQAGARRRPASSRRRRPSPTCRPTRRKLKAAKQSRCSPTAACRAGTSCRGSGRAAARSPTRT